MSGKIKLGAYAVLVILAVWFGLEFHSNYSAVSTIAVPSVANDTDTGPRVNQPAPATNAAPTTPSRTNAPLSATNAASTNALAATNEPAIAGEGSNIVEQTSNATPLTATAPLATNAHVQSPAAQTAAPALPTQSGRAVGYLAAFVVSLIGLGCLIAYDVTQLMGHQTVDFLFNDRGEGLREPEYEKAEQVWANGHHLEAIQLMRDYLRKNRREQYVALRIAEIYEKDLKNHLAAALEYEEILKKKLPDERWGWAAIHLCNLYNKMAQPAKAMALLERISNEYPKTGAAKKARKRLGWSEPEEMEQPEPEPETPAEPTNEEGDRKTFEVTNPEGDIIFEGEEEESEPPPPPPPPDTGLPPGFRKKK